MNEDLICTVCKKIGLFNSLVVIVVVYATIINFQFVFVSFCLAHRQFALRLYHVGCFCCHIDVVRHLCMFYPLIAKVQLFLSLSRLILCAWSLAAAGSVILPAAEEKHRQVRPY